MKGCAFVQLAFRGHFPAMSLDNFFADGKTNSGPFKIPLTVKSIKYFEYLFGILRLEPDPVVRHGNVMKILSALHLRNKVGRGQLRLKENKGGTVFFGELQRIADEI